MNKIEKIAQLTLLFLELITWLFIAKYNSPFAFIAVVVLTIVIDIILVDMSNE